MAMLLERERIHIHYHQDGKPSERIKKKNSLWSKPATDVLSGELPNTKYHLIHYPFTMDDPSLPIRASVIPRWCNLRNASHKYKGELHKKRKPHVEKAARGHYIRWIWLSIIGPPYLSVERSISSILYRDCILFPMHYWFYSGVTTLRSSVSTVYSKVSWMVESHAILYSNS